MKIDERKIYTFVVLSVIIFAVSILLLAACISNFSIAKSASFGDSFGVLTSLFSGLAFAGIIVSLRMQRKELSL